MGRSYKTKLRIPIEGNIETEFFSENGNLLTSEGAENPSALADGMNATNKIF